MERQASPPELTDEEWARASREYNNFRAKYPGVDCEPEPTRPSHRPAFRSLFFDSARRLWVEAYRDSGFAFEVFDTDGRLIAELEAPDRDPGVPPYVRGDGLVLVRLDSLGVQYVRRYRISDR